MAVVDGNTIVLLHLNTTLADSSLSPHTFSAAGNAAVSTAQKKFGAGSLIVDGTGDWISTPDAANISFAGGNFTYEFFIRLAAVPSSYTPIFGKWGTASNNEIMMVMSNSTTITLYTSTTGSDANTQTWTITAPTQDVWYHWALVRNGNTWTMYVDGVGKGDNTVTDTLYNGSSALHFGGVTGETPTGFNGFLDEIRVSNVARYTGNFTPPTDEFGLVKSGIYGYFDC